MIDLQTLDVAIRLTLFFMIVWPILRLLAQMLQGPIWRSYRLTPPSRPTMMQNRAWEDLVIRGLQYTTVVIVFGLLAQNDRFWREDAQANAVIAIAVAYSSTYWVTLAADWTVRSVARRRARALARAARAPLPFDRASRTIAQP